MNPSRLRDLRVFGTAVVVLVADQISKLLVRRYLSLGNPWNPVPWLRSVLSFTYVTNTGGSFGLFPRLGWAYTAVALAVVSFIVVFYRRFSKSGWLVQVSLGMQLGGAVGNNLVDRLWHGRVTDFIDLNFWPLQDWPVFNLADSCVVVGVCILAAHLLFEKEAPAKSPDSPADGC